MKQLSISTISERIAIGVDYLTDAEALSVLTDISVKVLSDLVKAYGFHGIIRQIDSLNLTHDERTRLELIYSMCSRIGKAKYLYSAPITSPDDIAQLFIQELQFSEVEVFAAAFLDIKGRLIKMEKLSRGTISSTVICQKDVVRKALLSNSSGIIVAHNHPSGSLIASQLDIATTKEMEQILALMDIALLDHIIVGNNQFLSFRKEGLL
jgi:DNA repair protein RadC